MADLNALRAALGRMDFSVPARNFLTADDGGQLTTIEHFARLKDGDVKVTLKLLNRPGGLVLNATGLQVPNPGIPVSITAGTNLKMMCYFLRFKEKTSRPYTAAMVQTLALARLRAYKDWEDGYENPAIPEFNLTGHRVDWVKQIKKIDELLRGTLGSATRVPLAYVVRETVTVPDHANDPDTWSENTKYNTIQDELIRRCPHNNGANPPVALPEFTNDNEAVYHIIATICRDKPCWTFIEEACKGANTRSGRAAYMALKNHYLGPHMVNTEVAKAEAILDNTIYTGETRRFNFDDFIRLQTQQHNILDMMKAHGYMGLDEGSKVRKLLKNVRAQELQSIINTINSTPDLQRDYTACVHLFETAIRQNKASNPGRYANISAINRHGKANPGQDKAWDDIQPDMSVEHRYYKQSEYKALSPAKKKGLMIKRDGERKRKRKGSPGGDPKNKRPGKDFAEVKAIQKEVKALKKQIKALKAQDDHDDEHDGGNRNNPALNRRDRSA